MLKKFSKCYNHFLVAAPSFHIFVFELSNVPYHLTKPLHLSADVAVSIFAPLLSHGALQRSPVVLLPPLRAHRVGPAVVTERVIPLVLPVLIRPLLPVVLQAFYGHRSVLTLLCPYWTQQKVGYLHSPSKCCLGCWPSVTMSWWIPSTVGRLLFYCGLR